MCTTDASGNARGRTGARCASSGVCSTARTDPTSPTLRATARIRRNCLAASADASASSSGTAAFTGATSPRSTKPGREPIAPARNVVPDRGDPMTKTIRSSRRPNRSARDAPLLGARRFATRSWLAVAVTMRGMSAILSSVVEALRRVCPQAYAGPVPDRRSDMALARVVTFEGVPSERIEKLREEVSSGDQPEGLNATEMLVLHDADAEKSIAIVLFENEDDYKTGDAILSAMPAGDTPGTRTSVSKYDVAIRMTS